MDGSPFILGPLEPNVRRLVIRYSLLNVVFKGPPIPFAHRAICEFIHTLAFCRKASKRPLASRDLDAFDPIPLPLIAYVVTAVSGALDRLHMAVLTGLHRSFTASKSTSTVFWRNSTSPVAITRITTRTFSRPWRRSKSRSLKVRRCNVCESTYSKLDGAYSFRGGRNHFTKLLAEPCCSAMANAMMVARSYLLSLPMKRWSRSMKKKLTVTRPHKITHSFHTSVVHRDISRSAI